MKVFCFFAILVFSTIPIFKVFKAANAFIATDDEDRMLCHKYPWGSSVSGDGDVRLFNVDPDRYAHTVHTKAVKFGFKHANLVKAFILNEQRLFVKTLNNRGGFEIACKENECA